MTHTSRANEDVSGGVVDNESLEFLGDAVLGFVVADMLFREFPQLRRRAEVEDQGVAGVDGDAGAAGRAAAARRSPAARPRRGEDRRPPQAGAARRHLRGADRGDLSRRRHRARARVHRARVRAAARRGAARRRVGQDYKSALQELLQSRDLPLPDYRLVGTPGPGSPQAVRDRGRRCAASRWRRRPGASKKEAEQEAARAALEKLRTEN